VSALILAELKRQTGRRGTFYGSIVVTVIFAVIIGIWASTTGDEPTRTEILMAGKGLVGAIAVMCAIVIGAIAGAYDTDQGTMRYLVLTGRPRWQLVIVRYIALIPTIVLATLPAILLLLLLQFIGPAGGPPSVDAHGWPPVLELFWGVWLPAVLYGFLSLSIGTFLKSNAVAIAVAIVLNFAGTLAAVLIWEYVSHALGNIFYPVVVDAVVSRSSSSAGPETSALGEATGQISLGASVAVLALWLVVLIGAAIFRAERSEY
jgi:ABC-type transport system involved in multi-copper enzyme maturation permease subunit